MIENPLAQEKLNEITRDCGLFGPETHYMQVGHVHGLIDPALIKIRGQYKEWTMRNLFLASVGGVMFGILVATQVSGPVIAQENDKPSIYEQLDLFGDIFERIRAQYVEEVDEGELIEAAIDGMLTSLDPHSSYLSPDDAAAMRVQTRGEFGGLGIEVTQ